MGRFSWAVIVLALAARYAAANDLRQYYELALTRDTTLEAAHFQRDALIEARPQAIAQWLPQVAANAQAARIRAGYDNGPALGSQAADCAISSSAGTQYCYGTAHTLGLNMSQTLWSFQAFSQLKEANFQVAAAEAGFQGAQESLVLRVAEAYFGILSAADQLATNRSERQAFAGLLNQAKVREQTGVGPRSDVEQAQAFYDATEQSVIDAQNALDDANLVMTEIVGQPVSTVAPLREDIPLLAPEPASADDWVVSARQDNFDVRTAQLKMEAASRDISVQRGRALPTIFLTGSSSKITENQLLGGNQILDSVGVSFSWPLFQGGAVASAVRQSRALLSRGAGCLRCRATGHRAQHPRRVSRHRQRHSAHRRDAPRRGIRGARRGGDAAQRRVRHRHRVRAARCAEQLLHRAARLQPNALRLSDQRADAQATSRPLDRAGSARHRRAAHRER